MCGTKQRPNTGGYAHDGSVSSYTYFFDAINENWVNNTKIEQAEPRFWHTVTTYDGAGACCILAISFSPSLAGGIYLIGGAKDLSGSYSNTVELINYGTQSSRVTMSPSLPVGVAVTSAIPVTDSITF